MKKINKKEIGLLSILLAVILVFVSILYIKGYVYGSSVDYASQHIVIPEYLRSLFYSSGKIIPSFALNLGMGQNIYYFSYYGLLSPFILLSYLLPFVPMYIYIPLISLLSLIFSVYLMYDWVKGKYNVKIAYLISIIFMLNAPFFYHFHRHIMFVIYMPFLIMALKSVDKYLKEKKPVNLIIMVLLMILTSYYFSVTGIFTIGIYSLYRLLEKKKFETKKLFKIIFYVVIAILLSSVLLVPTIYTLFEGRAQTLTSSFNLLYLLNPLKNYEYTFYNSYYSWGITLVYIIAIINAFTKKNKSNIFLGIITSIYILIPGVSYLYNAFMYIDGKAFITFIPVALLLVANLFKDIDEKNINVRKIVYVFMPTIIYLIFAGYSNLNFPLLLLDIVLTLIGLRLINKNSKPYYTFVIIISIISCIISSFSDTYLKKSELERVNNKDYYNIKIEDKNLYRTSVLDDVLTNVNKIYNINQLSSSMYSSTSNKYYFNFVRNVFQNEIINRDNTTITSPSSVLFNIYSATKYLVGNDIDIIGYKKVTNNENINLYQNDNVLPIGYSTTKVMSLREFNTLTYPENIDALLHYVIINNDEEADVYQKTYSKYKSGYKLVENNKADIEFENDHYIIKTQSKTDIKVRLNEQLENKILIVKFNMNKAKEGYACSSDITINGIKNSLSCSNWKYNNNNNTFEYVLSSNKPITTLDITFSKGEFDISNIELYTFEYEELKTIKSNIYEFKIDQDKTKGNKVVGTIDSKKDGVFKITIPYESKGFSVYVDGVKTNIKLVDTAFIGFNLKKGEHTIEIVYKTPLLNLGYILSIVGIILFVLTLIRNKLSLIYERVSKKVRKVYLFVKRIVKKFVNRFIKRYKGYIYLFLSLYILDLSLRIFHNANIHYYQWIYPIPNLFSILWIVFILYLVKLLNNKLGKTLFFITYVLSLGLFLTHSIYYSFFNLFFDFSVLSVAGEGTAYFNSVLSSIDISQIITIMLSVLLCVIGIKNINHSKHFEYKKALIAFGIFIVIHTILPIFLGRSSSELTWDEWRNARTIYKTYNDNNKSLMVSGMYEYNIRNFYVNYLRPEEGITKEEKEILEKNFETDIPSEPNKYTSVFEGKNIIIVQLESIDSFLVTKNTMPTLYNLTKNSINFKNHYSFTSGGGSTFNSEFMVNTGYSTAYNSNKNAYSFSKNNFKYSLANLLKERGYTSNVFHMNTSEYYSRAVNYKAFGYEKYYGLQDIKNYKNKEYWLDTELIKNETFNELIFDSEGPTLNYIITYSAHMPFSSNKGVCHLLTDVKGLTEYQCLKIQAKETDDMLKLLIKNLRERDKLDDTVLVIFSDHYLYTLEDKTLLDKYKDTSTNLINYTPFIIYNNGNVYETVSEVNSQLDILPTLLNMMGVSYNTNNYIGTDIFSANYDPLVFFPDGSYYNGKTYIANGEYLKGQKMSKAKISKYNEIVKNKMTLNDAIIKSDYFEDN